MRGYFYIGFIDFMLAGKTLIDFTSLFYLQNFEKNDNIIIFLKMNKVSFVQAINTSSLSDKTKFH